MSTGLPEMTARSDLVLPTFLIIGAMKSGSTSLARYLGAHPEVFLAPCKEIHYFDRHHEEGIEWYSSHFEPSSGESAVGEATPNYLYFPEAIDRLVSTVPNAKLIAILRNPVDRAYSHYWHERARGREDLDFRRALAAEPERIAKSNLDARMHFSYLDQGRYLKQLRYVTDRFTRENLLVVLSENLRNYPEATFGTVCDFLEIDPRLPSNVGDTYNAYVSFRSLRVRKFARRLSSGNRLQEFLGRVIGRLNTRRKAYPPMRAKIRAELLAHYEKENEALSSWLGRDLSSWVR